MYSTSIEILYFWSFGFEVKIVKECLNQSVKLKYRSAMYDIGSYAIFALAVKDMGFDAPKILGYDEYKDNGSLLGYHE